MKKITFTILGLAITSLIFTSCSKEEGCTDPAATNFNVDAEKDDGSCVYQNDDDEPVNTKSRITVSFTHNFDGYPMNFSNFSNTNFVTQNGDTINSIARIRYLISDLTLYKPNGDSVIIDDYQLVDLSDPSSFSFTTGEIEMGSYSSIGFTWGFDSISNQQNYIDLNSANWNWPAMIGGGYHFMQWDGTYLNNGTPSPFNYHNGTASNMGNHEANHVDLKFSGIALNEANVTLELKMNFAEFFRNPYQWDLNVYNTMLMPNFTAQKLIHDQIYTVFSIGSVTQKY